MTRRTQECCSAKVQRQEEMFDTVVRKYNNWVQYRRTVDELSRLSRRELSDLGISRNDIKFVARRTSV